MKDRTLNLLRILISSNTPLSVEYLATYFSISRRSIYYEIRTLNNFFAENGYSKIRSIRNLGYILDISKENKLKLCEMMNNIESEYYSNQERLLDLLLSVTLGLESVFLVKKESEFKVSKASIDEDIRKIRESAAEFELEIISSGSNGMQMIGPEKNIRMFLFLYLEKQFEVINIKEQTLQDNNFQNILYKYIPKNIFNILDKIYSEVISEVEEGIYRKNILLYSAIWWIRISRSKLISKEDYEVDTDFFDNRFIEFSRLLVENIGLVVPVFEQHQLISVLSSLNNKTMPDYSDWIKSQMLTLKIISNVEKVTGLSFLKNEIEIQKGLNNHIISLLTRLKHDIQFNNPLKKTIIEKYNILYEAVKTTKSIFYKYTKKDISDDEIAFMVIYFLPFFNGDRIELKTIYRAVVICHHGKITGNLLAKNLQAYFPIEITNILGTKEINLLPSLDFDIIFSTIPISDSDYPILVIDPIINEDNFNIIRHFLECNEGRILANNNFDEKNNIYTQLINMIKQEGIKITPEIYSKVGKILDENNIKYSKREVAPMIEDVLSTEEIIINRSARN